MSKIAPAVRRMASTVMGYGLAVLCVVAALLVTRLLQHVTNGPPWVVFLAAVMISSWVAGLGPGLLAVLLSTLAVDYFFVPPLHILSPNFCAKTGGIKTRKIGPQVAYCLGFAGLETGGMPP